MGRTTTGGTFDGVRARVEREVARAVEEHGLWPAGATLIVAVSGGADSLCLLGTLLALGERGHPLAPREVVVAHLDHGLRGEAGAADARFVADLARQLGLRFVGDRVDVAALARASRRSLEDAARQARYAFLRRVAADGRADRIVTGHTRDDQAETVVLHFLRGSGLAGLVGMQPLSGDIARPLLSLTREQTEAYCAARGWVPREDASNRDLRFARNRIRHELLPLLEAYNLNLRETLARNATLLADDARYLDARADAAWQAIARGMSAESVALDLAELRTQPAALRHRIFRRASQQLVAPTLPRERGLEARHIQALDALLATGTTGDRIDLPGGLRVRLDYETLWFERTRGGQHPAPGERTEPQEHVLPVPGVVELPETGWRVRAWLSEQTPGLEARHESETAHPPATLPAFERTGTTADVGRAESRVYLDADVAGEPLSVRTWRPGDRFRPLGMPQEKKLQDFFTDAKVPREVRHRLPLVFGARHLLWVAGQRIDDRAQLTPTTQRILVLALEPISPRDDGAR